MLDRQPVDHWGRGAEIGHRTVARRGDGALDFRFQNSHRALAIGLPERHQAHPGRDQIGEKGVVIGGQGRRQRDAMIGRRQGDGDRRRRRDVVVPERIRPGGQPRRRPDRGHGLQKGGALGARLKGQFGAGAGGVGLGGDRLESGPIIAVCGLPGGGEKTAVKPAAAMVQNHP